MKTKKTIVYYYSNKGNNRFLAEKIAESLSSDLEEIRPRINFFPLFLLNFHLGNRPSRNNISDYDTVILCGPIWVGKLIPPLRSFILSYKDSITKLIFVTCCGSSDALKDEKFGHGTVFKKVRYILGDKCALCQAFPIVLVLPEEKKTDSETIMNTRLSGHNFKGEIVERYNNFISKVEEIRDGS